MHQAVGVRVRPYDPADAEAVAGLLGELGYATSPPLAAAFARRFGEDENASLLVATVDGDVVGLVATCLVPRLHNDGLSCRITDLVVTASRRRQGAGRALMAAAEATARAAGARRLDLSTGDWRSDAHAFYARLGFHDNARALTRRLE
jgi:GNAT superfamily N-acetyltransferase